MTFTWIIVLLVAMVHTRATNKLKRAKKTQKKDEFVLIEDSEKESDKDDVDWDKLTDDKETPVVAKGKFSSSTIKRGTPTAKDKGKAPMTTSFLSVKRKRLASRRGRARGIEINEPMATDSPPRKENVSVNTDRLKAFENRECIGERHVNIAALRNHSAEFGNLIEDANLIQVCRFPETLGYCLHLVKTFYSNAGNLQENENGPMAFYTNVHGTRLKITPRLIGEVLEMPSCVSGVNYLKGKSLTSTLWQSVVKGICLEGTQSAGKSVKSNQLRLEYRFLHLITCYNVLPNMQTKVLRWDRMLFLYLLGHPLEAVGLNINIPYVIWNRMSRYVEHPHPTERLPFSLIIMRILKKFQVDISSTSYQHSSGMINESTIVKSLHKLPHVTPSPKCQTKPSVGTSESPPRAAPMPEDEASVTSIFKEQPLQEN